MMTDGSVCECVMINDRFRTFDMAAEEKLANLAQQQHLFD